MDSRFQERGPSAFADAIPKLLNVFGEVSKRRPDVLAGQQGVEVGVQPPVVALKVLDDGIGHGSLRHGRPGVAGSPVISRAARLRVR